MTYTPSHWAANCAQVPEKQAKIAPRFFPNLTRRDLSNSTPEAASVCSLRVPEPMKGKKTQPQTKWRFSDESQRRNEP